MTSSTTTAYTVYKSDVSYFSGKLEAYLRYKGIPYNAVDCKLSTLQYIGAHTGVQKMPAVEMDNGQWLFDTTPTLAWFEQHYTETPILPEDPALRFLALLMEDYGDEWLWRPAMWWRWIPQNSSRAVGWQIGAETFHPKLARIFGFIFKQRQRMEWLWGDGVSRENSLKVRDMLFDELAFLEPLLENQPYLLGSHPSAADFGYFSAMFRHFGNDPAPAEAIRRHGPNTYEWLARLWNASPKKLAPTQHWQWPEDPHWEALLDRLANDYLPYLHQNAIAFRDGKKRFNHSGKHFTFNKTKTTHYRVWCREQLQAHFKALTNDDQQRINALFEPVGGLKALHQDGVIESGLSFELPVLPNQPRKRPSFITTWLGQARN